MTLKPILWIIVLLILVSTASAANVELTICGGTTGVDGIGDTGANMVTAATNFTVNSTYDGWLITNISMYSHQLSSNDGELVAELRLPNSTNISGVGVRNGSVTAVASAWNTVTLNDTYAITAGNSYWAFWKTTWSAAETGYIGIAADSNDGCGAATQSIETKGPTWTDDTVNFKNYVHDFGLKIGLQSPPSGSTDLNLTAVDDFTGSAINTFSVNITFANGTVYSRSTTTGTVALLNLGDNGFNVNLTYFNITNYYNLTLLNQAVTANTSQTITASLYQAIASFTARAKVSNATVNGASFATGSKTGTTFNLTAATHTVNASQTGWYNRSQSFIIAALTNTSQTVTGMYSSEANITFYRANGSVVTDWGISITSTTYPSWTGEVNTTTTGSYTFYGINGTYTAVINSSLGNGTYTFTIDATTENISFYYFSIDNCSNYTNTMLNFTILHELTDGLLNDSVMNIWVNATSDFLTNALQFNFSFDTGNYYALCVPDNTVLNWTVNAQAEYSNLPSYAEKNYWFSDYPLNASPTAINLYLTNGTTQVTLQLRDYNDDAISDAYISVLSYDLGTNSYKTTEIVKTDSEGDAFVQIIQDTAWYAFLVEYDGEIILQTLPTKLDSATLTLRANLDTDYFASYDVVQGVATDLTYTNATTTFSFTWSDPTGSVAQGCLKLTRHTINGDTVLNTSCTTSSAATLLMKIPESVGTNTYQADGYLVISGQNFAAATRSVSFNTTYKTFGLSGVFFSMLIILVLVMVGLWHPVVAIALMLVGVVATNVMGIFYLNWTYIVTFIILGVITMYRTGKSD